MTLTGPTPLLQRRVPSGATRLRATGGRRPDLLIVPLLMVLTAVAHGLNAAGWPAFFDDEGTYLSQAQAIYEGDLAPYQYWYDHPPLGWIQLAAVSWLPAMFVETQLVAGRLSMTVFSVAAVALVYGVALRLRLRLRRGFAVLAAVLWAMSPLTVFESRQVFLDSIAVPWLLGSLFLALSPRKHLGHYMLSGALLGGAILTKETTAVFAPAIFLAMWLSAYRQTRAFCVAAFVTAAGMVGSVYLLFAVLKGELIPGEGHVSLLDALVFQTMDRRGSGFVLAEGSGAYGLLQSWLGMDRLLIIGGVACILPCLLNRRLRAVGLAVLIPTVVALRPNGYLPFMYVTAALPFAALAIAAVADRAWTAMTDVAGRYGVQPLRMSKAAAALALVLAAALTVLPQWTSGYRTAWAADHNRTHDDAVAWITANASPEDRIVVDNNYWLDLKAAGWDDPWRNIWFTKLDLDPIEAQVNLPNGYRDIDYVIKSRAFAYLGSNSMPTTEAALENSEVVVSFGGPDDPDYVEVRRVLTSDSVPPVAPPAPPRTTPPDPQLYEQARRYVDEEFDDAVVVTDREGQGPAAPRDWRGVDVLITAEETTESSVQRLRQLSYVVEVFGDGGNQVEVRRVFPNISDFEGVSGGSS